MMDVSNDFFTRKILLIIVLNIFFINVGISKTVNDDNVYAKYINKNYTIDIYFGCIEGEMSCDKMTYHGVNNKTKEEITLHGKVITSGPYLNFVGYQFKNGNYIYIIDERSYDFPVLQVFLIKDKKEHLLYQDKLTSIDTPNFQFPKSYHFVK